MNTEERFWSKIVKGTNDVCWNWLGSKRRDGYGRFWVSKGKIIRAHRYAYQLSGRTIENGKFIMHICDNPACVNPFHLIQGTPRDNVLDMISKGRGNAGKYLRKNPEKCNLAKLTRDHVLEIRKLCAKGDMFHKDIGKLFGITRHAVGLIHTRKRWKYI